MPEGITQGVDDASPKKSGKLWPVIILLAVIAGLGAAAKLLPVVDYLKSFLAWTETVGFWGPVVVIGVYIVACVLMAPGSIITLGAGILFGVLKGTVAVSIGSTLGACAAFLCGRTLARSWVSAKVSGNARFAAIDEAVGKEGFKIVFLTRLSPIFPFNLLNYAYGLTKVSFGHYALASWIGMIPGTIMYVYIGSTIRSLAELGAGGREKGVGERIFFWAGLVVTVAVVAYVTRVARRVLAKSSHIEQADGAPAVPAESAD